ncbi:Serine/threonine-protein kinase [Pichia californica]|uniref:non-specific serine/threonine protein kinase n=1 Tax=Pichia californica TaxID=460514 RepID=A0A9P7BHU5_9ASCO|nr:Serine/threonine-protein kinase [[Candida] californica]
MNFDFSTISPTAHTIAISAYIDFLPSLQYSKPLGTSRFLKTIQCLSPSGYKVVKLLIKPSGIEIDMHEILDNLNKLKFQLIDIPNTLPFDTLIDSERATYLIRPYARYNLYDRLSIRPFFESIEKKWIVYQLLVTLNKMHENNIFHGDLKTENVLLTSWNWILLSDIGLFKPVYLPDQNQSHFSFYFDTIQRHSCYIAPERFKSQSEIDELFKNPENIKLTPEVDIFSLGCVIAELYTDGLPIFSLPQMFRYKRGEYTPNLDAIEDSNIRKLIQSMISLNPNDRLSAKQYLTNFRKILFPDFFYTFLYTYMKNLSSYSPISTNDSTVNFQICDYRIDRLYKDFDKIALYLGFKSNIIDVDEKSANNINNGSLIPVELNLSGMNKHIPQNTSAIFTKDSINDCSSLILLSFLCHNVRNTTHSSYRIKSCDLILAFGEQLHDEAKFDRCLPYLINMLDDPSENVQISALCCMTQLLMMIDTITPINIHVFTEYIVPKLQLFLKRSYINVNKDSLNSLSGSSKYGNRSQQFSSYNSKSQDNLSGSYVRMVFACCLPHLAITAKKFYELSILLKNKVGAYHDSDIDSIIFNDRDRNESEYAEIVQNFEHLTIQILTDNSIYVRIALMRNIRPLCFFFGKDKTNDVILSHLITYLNDKNPQIKLAFISSIVPLSIFVGITGLEQYILPLLVQALYGPEETIVITLLKVLSVLINLGLIRKECFWDLVKLSVVLILHPNGLIRQSVLNLIITIGNQLSMSDFYCMLYPLIRPFFQHEVTNFTWNSLYIAAHNPLSRAVYNKVTIWSLSTHDSLFWQRVDMGSKNVDMFGNTKLVFAKKKNMNPSMINSTTNTKSDDFISNFEVPLSNSDLKNIEKLQNLGFKKDELWKITSLRAYIFKISRLSTRTTQYATHDDICKLIPRSVFVDVIHKYDNNDNIGTTKILKNAERDILSLKLHQKPTGEMEENGGALILKTLQNAKPIVTTSDQMVFGESSIVSGKQNNQLFQDFGDANVYDETMQLKKLTTNISFSYPGKNPFILKFLKSLNFEPDIQDYQEFGDLIDISIINNNNKENADMNKNCVLIARFIEHKAGIVDIIVSPDHEYFISGDSSGILKIWESKRLEIDVTGESCISVNMGSPIKSMCIMKDRHCFAVSKEDGSISIFRVDFVSTLENSNLKKYKKTSITLLKYSKVKPKNEYVTNLQFNIIKGKPYLFMITPTANLIGIDIRSMEEVYCLQNNILHGSIQSLIIDESQSWAVLGTNKGVIDLWDLEAGLCVKSTKFKHGSFGISKMIEINNELFSSTKTQKKIICFIGGTGDSDVIIWDVERGQPRIVLCSNNKQSFSTIELYSVCEVKDEIEDKLLNIYINKELTEIDNGCTSIGYSSFGMNNFPGKIVCSLKNNKIIEWNLEKFQDSRVVIDVRGNEGHVGDYPVYSETQVNSTLTFVNERYVSSTNKDTTASNRVGNGPKLVNKSPCDIVSSLTYLQIGNMSELDMIECIDIISSDLDSLEFSDYDSIEELDYDDQTLDEREANQTKMLYTFPVSQTSNGTPTHRMKYQTLSHDDLILQIDQKVKSLGEMLELDPGKCLLILIQYSWNNHKLLDDYVNSKSRNKYLLKYGVTEKKFPKNLDELLSLSKKEDDLCGICCCGPDPKEPMEFFSLYGCKHKFCTDCYGHYIKSKNSSSTLLIECPFRDPRCELKLTVQELKILSDFMLKTTEFNAENTTLHFISKDQIVEVYNLTSDEEQFDEFGNVIDQFDGFGDFKKKKSEKERIADINDLIFDFHSTMEKKEIEEIERKRNHTLLSRYWFNVSVQFCTTQGKKFALCPYPDCDSILECVGFDSNDVASLDEQVSMMMVPIVKCSRNHLFCYNCLETYHAPCPCQLVSKWKKKCQDDTETLNWLQTNTKLCPKCHANIEKNGGCNHISCLKCKHQFCWICMGTWCGHNGCSNYRESTKVGKDEKASYQKYMFYFDRFNSQRISHDKDLAILEKFEGKIRELQVKNGVSWIETVFYKECVSALLESRQSLKWSYAYLFYLPKCSGKELIETAQWQLSNQVEALSKLFADTPVADVISKKSKFLSYKSSMIDCQLKFLETCIETFSDKSMLKTFKNQHSID